MTIKRNVLGRGLSALLENSETDVMSKRALSDSPAIVGNVAVINIEKIEANPFQPRSTFEEEALQELAASIKEQGIIQPITVRKMGYDKYLLISGERRFKASKIAGLTSIPAYIRIANDEAMLEMALVENIQREDLNAIEISIALKRLIDECAITHEKLSERVGKNRSTITNYLRLLKLPVELQIAIRDNKISMGHARAIINIEDRAAQLTIYRDIVENNLSVRDVEEIVRNFNHYKTRKKNPQAITSPTLSFELRKIQNNLSSQFETKVEIKSKKDGTGKIVIQYLSTNDLNRVLEKLNY